MTDKFKIYFQSSSEPVKVLANRNRRGIILRQASSYVFIDAEVADAIIDAMCSIADEFEAEVQR